jgi:hypothetical protein
MESFISPIMMATISGSLSERMRAFSTAEHSLPLVNTSMACFAAFPEGHRRDEQDMIEQSRIVSQAIQHSILTLRGAATCNTTASSLSLPFFIVPGVSFTLYLKDRIALYGPHTGTA